MLKSISILFSGCILLFIACDNEVVTPTPLGYEYYPLEIGSYLVYQLDSVIFDPDINGIRRDSSSSQIKEVVVDSFRDASNILMYKIERYYRPDESTNWKIQTVFTKGIDEKRAIHVEDNLRFIKLVFPPKDFKDWDGNVHFDEYTEITVAGEPLQMFKGPWDYQYEETGVPYAEFDDVLNVIDAYQDSSIRIDYYNPGYLNPAPVCDTFKYYGPKCIDTVLVTNRLHYRSVIEKYARNIGLIYREVKIMDAKCGNDGQTVKCDSIYSLCNDIPTVCDSLTWEEKAETGFILIQRLIDHQ